MAVRLVNCKMCKGSGKEYHVYLKNTETHPCRHCEGSGVYDDLEIQWVDCKGCNDRKWVYSLSDSTEKIACPWCTKKSP